MAIDNDRQRLQDDLRGLVAGDVLADNLSLQLYASDASIYQIHPLAVVRPRNAADISAVVQYAADQELSVHARGSGSGVAGESLGRGIVLDMSRYLRKIKTSQDKTKVTVQSGATLAAVNRMLIPNRRWYGPDPANRSITTMGSVIATNASGSHYLRSGSARDTIESVRMINADGDLVELAQHHRDDFAESTKRPATTDSGELYRNPTLALENDEEEPAQPHQRGLEFRDRVARGLLEIRSQFSKPLSEHAWPSMSGGYRLDDCLDEHETLHLAKFFAGTQGTLGILVDATLRTEFIPTHRGVVLLFFHRLDSAMRAAIGAADHGPIACDVIDRRLLQIARESEQRFAKVIPREAEAAMLVEIQSESLGDLYHRLAIVRQVLSTGTDGAFASKDTIQDHVRDGYWSLFRRAIPRQYGVSGTRLPIPFVEDIYAPPDQLPRVLVAVQDVLKRFQVPATVFAHAGHGQLQIRPMLDLSEESDRDKIRPISEAVAEVVWKLGGQIGVQHPAGLSRSYLLPHQFGPLWPAIGQVKRLFDPYHRLNPGKLFGAVLQKPDENLRPFHQTIEIVSGGRSILPRRGGGADESSGSATASQTERWVSALMPHEPPAELEVLQHWTGSSPITKTTRACNGCGRCRTHSTLERQCPMFRINSSEEASPRAKANLLRGVLSGELSAHDITTEHAKEVADLCFNCHSCRMECPAGVDIPKVVGEIKAQYVATNGLPLSDYLIGRIDTLAAIGSRVAWLSNFVLRNRTMRWLGENSLGVSAAREIPPLASESFTRYATKRRWHRMSAAGGLKVVYFVDHFANYHDPAIGRALAEVLQHNQIGFYVPTGQSLSGMARITAGDLKGARKVARRNVAILADAVRQGYTVVATEPAAALCLQHEYPALLDSEDAHLVANHSHEACHYLWSLHQGDRLTTEFETLECELVYHQPCHSRVLDPTTSAANLMNLIPGVNVDILDKGCSGMAGTWGLQRKNYRNSLRIGWPLMSAVRRAPGATPTTECSACKLQMQHGSDRLAVHPLKILAMAYGRFPREGTLPSFT